MKENIQNQHSQRSEEKKNYLQNLYIPFKAKNMEKNEQSIKSTPPLVALTLPKKMDPAFAEPLS